MYGICLLLVSEVDIFTLEIHTSEKPDEVWKFKVVKQDTRRNNDGRNCKWMRIFSAMRLLIDRHRDCKVKVYETNIFQKLCPDSKSLVHEGWPQIENHSAITTDPKVVLSLNTSWLKYHSTFVFFSAFKDKNFGDKSTYCLFPVCGVFHRCNNNYGMSSYL